MTPRDSCPHSVCSPPVFTVPTRRNANALQNSSRIMQDIPDGLPTPILLRSYVQSGRSRSLDEPLARISGATSHRQTARRQSLVRRVNGRRTAGDTVPRCIANEEHSRETTFAFPSQPAIATQADHSCGIAIPAKSLVRLTPELRLETHGPTPEGLRRPLCSEGLYV